MADFLPEDVMYEIFLRLPLKSLVRCRCICKQWQTLISRPSFVGDHLRRSSAVPLHNRILLHRRRIGSNDSELGLCPPNSNEFSAIESASYPTRSFSPVGSHNGVICLLSDQLTTYLCNPSINEFFILPKSQHSSKLWSVGFGFNPHSGHLDDFGVVKIYKKGSVELYCLRTNVWKQIKHCYPPTYLLKYGSYPVTFREFICWANPLYDDVEDIPLTNYVLLFDLVNEELKEIRGPDLVQPFCYMTPSLLGDRLILMLWGRDGKQCQVWVMEEVGVSVESWTWTKLYEFQIDAAVGVHRDYYMPIGFIDNKHLLLKHTFLDGTHELTLYNAVKREVEVEQSYSFNYGDSKWYKYKLLTYLESLVSVIPLTGNRSGE